ncbi:MAG: C39 family peptidase [Proteobacteria bacterium]|nr:C39 family peptidase [Pseudomonadota bacterium]
MELFIAFVIGICLINGYAPLNESPKDELLIKTAPNTPYKIRNTVIPGSKMKYNEVVRQTYDYSCGSAALATLLRFYLGEDITEQNVIQGLLLYGDKEQIIKRRAFSLLDMKKYVNVLGYEGTGYRAELEDLTDPANWPCIIPITLFDYRHFVILKGVHDGHIFFSDSFSGNSSYPLSTFETLWYEKIVFIVTPRGGKGLSALKLKPEDLQYITESEAKRFFTATYKPFDIPSTVKMTNIPGQKQFYKP